MATEEAKLSPKSLDELDQLREILYGQQFKAVLDQIALHRQRLESHEDFQQELARQDAISARAQQEMEQRLLALSQSLDKLQHEQDGNAKHQASRLEAVQLDARNQISKVAAELSRMVRGLQSDILDQLDKRSKAGDEIRSRGEQALRQEIEQKSAALDARIGEFEPRVVDKLADIEHQLAVQGARFDEALAIQVKQLRTDFEARLQEHANTQNALDKAQFEMKAQTEQRLAELADYLGRLDEKQSESAQSVNQRLADIEEQIRRLETAAQQMDERLSQRMIELVDALQKRIDETHADQAAALLAWRAQSQESGEAMHKELLDLAEALERRKISRQELGKALADLSQTLLGD